MDQILPLSGQLLSLPLASGPVNVDQRCDVMKPHEATSRPRHGPGHMQATCLRTRLLLLIGFSAPTPRIC